MENVDTLINSAGAGPSQPRSDAPRVTTLRSHESAATNVDELERQPEAVQAEFGQAETVHIYMYINVCVPVCGVVLP